MKLTNALVILLVFCSAISRKVKRTSSHRRHLARVPADNILYQFLLGFVSSLSGDTKAIDECSKEIKGWESAAIEEKGNTEKELGRETSSTFETILGYLGKAVDAICNFKNDIIKFITKKYRRYMRLFLQGKISRRFGRGIFSGVWDSIQSNAKAIASAVVSGVKAVGNEVIKAGEWVGKKAEDFYNFVKDQISKVLQPIYDLFEKVKARFLAYLEKNPLMKQLLNFCNCFINKDGVKGAKTFYNAVKSLITLIPKLGTPIGWIELIVNLICGWESLKDGIGSLIIGLKEKSNTIKYNHYGKFVGKLVKAIAG